MSIISRLVKTALAASKLSDHTDYLVGAAAYRSGRIIGIGFNSNKTSTKTKNLTKRIHAEFSLLNRCKNIEKSVVLVLRNTRLKNIRMAKPCVHCAELLDNAKVKKILYTDNCNNIRDFYTDRIIANIEQVIS